MTIWIRSAAQPVGVVLRYVRKREEDKDEKTATAIGASYGLSGALLPPVDVVVLQKQADLAAGGGVGQRGGLLPIDLDQQQRLGVPIRTAEPS